MGRGEGGGGSGGDVWNLWSHILLLELEASRGEPCDTRIQRLGTRLATLCRQYSMKPKYFPIGNILKYSLRE